MGRLADTVAAELAQRAWHGYDAPGEITEEGISAALARTFNGTVTLLDVGEWAAPGMRTLFDAGDMFTFQARFTGAIAAAMILGAKLQETNCT